MVSDHVRFSDGVHLPVDTNGKAAFLAQMERDIEQRLSRLTALLHSVKRLNAFDVHLNDLEDLACEFAAIDPTSCIDDLLGLTATPPAWWNPDDEWKRTT